jgi:nucleotide-binding universal stress UspA family protein
MGGGREAARAVFDALPMLKLAEKVHIVTVEDSRTPREGSLPDTEIASALARHGIDVTIAKIPAGDASAGDEILREVAEQGSDLLVMGAYGHSRLREFVFGGVTRQILREMTVPVLFSH